MLHRIVTNLVLSLAVIGLTAAPLLAAQSETFGINSFVSSLSGDFNKQSAVNATDHAEIKWIRQEFTFADSMDFAPYDVAVSKARAKGLKILGLLIYPGSGKSHDVWKNYVQSLVNRYGRDVAAWEVMNEADNYLSASEYVTYLKEARAIIKGNNPEAAIVSSGISTRIESANFFDGIAAAGGWGALDVVGVHAYHGNSNPERVNFGGGDFVANLERVVGSINRNGGGKKIWITESGYTTADVGEGWQANWLARSIIMARSVPEVERIFVYKLVDDNGADGYGLMKGSFQERPAYRKMRELVINIGYTWPGTRLYPQQKGAIDNLDSLNRWATNGSVNSSTGLSISNRQDLKINYSFSNNSAYALAEKNVVLNGQPSGLAAWIMGDDSSNVWKFRIKDSQGETFQMDLGNIPSKWSYKQFAFNSDTAKVSWGGNGVIDYPITFNAVVIDRQGNQSQGSGIIGDLMAVYGEADLFAYQFGDTVTWWQASGTTSANLCKGQREFSEEPRYTRGINCDDMHNTKAVAAVDIAATDRLYPAPAAPTCTRVRKLLRLCR